MRYLALILLLVFPVFSSFGGEITKGDARAYREEGYKAQSMGDFKTALSDYQKAVETDPNYFEAINDLGVAYEAAGDNDKAVEMYKRALKIKDDYLPAYSNLAFFYEKQGDVKEASYFWRKRYEKGVKGEYWTEAAKQHLLALGDYPEVRRDNLEQQALSLSKDLTYKREQSKLKTLDEAKLHFYIGSNLFLKSDYLGCLKELETVISLNPDDADFLRKTNDLYKQAKRSYAKEQALGYSQEAINSIKSDDFLSAGEKLKSALSAVFRVSQENSK
jgi:tetratricopeptide (TPR) repeat protein